MKPCLLLSVAFSLLHALSLVAAEVRPPGEIAVVLSGRTAAVYHTQAPKGTKLVVASGDFLHPVFTPNGTAITDFAPSDHPHHRGVFLGWVEMHGAKDADFWGWGEHAPIKDRQIINRTATTKNGSLEAESDWVADGVVLVHEKLMVTPISKAPGQVSAMTLAYELTPESDLTLTRWAFSGFCLRTRKEGAIEFSSPEGVVNLPNPSHLKPESDWPDAPWYACTVKLDSGPAGAAIINHPSNPPTLWHNHRDVRMLNPCIVAPAEVRLQKGKPLRLRYAVVTFDGETPNAALNQLAADFRK